MTSLHGKAWKLDTPPQVIDRASVAREIIWDFTMAMRDYVTALNMIRPPAVSPMPYRAGVRSDMMLVDRVIPDPERDSRGRYPRGANGRPLTNPDGTPVRQVIYQRAAPSVNQTAASVVLERCRKRLEAVRERARVNGVRLP